MSEIPVNNINNVVKSTTPLYDYQNLPQPSAAQPVNSVGNYTNQIYQYPTSSIYSQTPAPQYSGVNIQILNPAGYMAPAQVQYPYCIIPNQTCNTPAPIQSQTPIAPQTPTIYDKSLPSQTVPQAQDYIADQAPREGANASTTLINNLSDQNPIPNTSIVNNNEVENKPHQKTKFIVELTDDYIKTLENYLRNENADVRKMGINELIKRYEEEKSRYNNPSLSALLNIALQDPSPSNRLLAMSVIASGSAQGNDDTIKLLQNLTTSDKLYGQESKMANDALINAVQVKVEVPDYSQDKTKTKTKIVKK